MTDALHGLVRQLSRPRAWRWPGTPDPRLPVLAEIGQRGDATVLPYLIRPMGEGGVVGRVAASAAHQILARTPITDYPALGRRIRGSWRWWIEDATVGWVDMRPDRLRRNAPSGWLRTPYFGLASLHNDGHVREAAVQELALERTGDEIPFLVLRLNDWVAPIRHRAEAAVRERIRAEFAHAWGRALPLVLGLDARGRHQAAFVVADVVGLLVAMPDALRSVLTFPDRAVRRAGHRVALDAGGEAAHLAARLAVDDADLIVRLATADALRSGRLVDAEAEAALLSDPVVGVRRRVLLGLVGRDAPEADAALRGALLDESAGIRRDARFYLARRTGESIGAEVYREALVGSAPASVLRGALGGLAETGDAADAASALSFLDDDRPSVRAAGLQTLLALDPDPHAPRILRMVEDPASRVVRTAVRAVASGRLSVEDSEATLARWHREGDGVQVREAFRALAALPYWTRLPYVLSAYDASDPRIARIAQDGVARWLARSLRVFTSPTPDGREAIRHALSEAALPDDIRREVADVVARR